MASTTDNDLLHRVLSQLKVVRGPDARGECIAWCPFHRDGQGKPPHRPNLQVSERGFCCHACGASGGLRALASKLGVTIGRPDGGIEATYDYLDEEGDLLFEVVRFSGKRFRQRRPDGRAGRIWKMDGVRRVLYRLPELSARPDDTVFVTEGEKDCDRLHRAGLLATTNPGGAGKWRNEYATTLENRDVVVLADNDDVGRKHAAEVARSLSSTARCVKVLELPGLQDKGDVSDWLEGGHAVTELLALVDEAPLWEPKAAESEDDQPTGEESSRRESQASVLVRLALATGLELFHDERGEPYAVMRLPERRRILSLDAKDFGRWLSRLAWEQMQKAPGGEVVAATRLALSSIARFDGPQHSLYVRSAWMDGAIWLDLDGTRAIKVTCDGWDVVDEPPILFRTFPHQKPLPFPTKGGLDPRRVLEFVNLRGEEARLLFPCYLVAALVPGIPMVALVIHGVQGSAKTTLLKVVKNLLDPSIPEVRGGVRDQGEFALAAWQNRVLFFDNLTSMPSWLSDALCRAVTGEGWSKRTLYTNEDLTFFEYQPVIGFAGISLVADQPDLLDRSLILPLEPIPSARRKPERLFWREYHKAAPDILGGLLDALAGAMRVEPELEMPELPRMADFARWGAAAAAALGWEPDDFLDAYRRNTGRQNEAAVEGSPVAQAVLTFMENRVEEWRGTAAELLERLGAVAEGLRIDTRDRSWPKSPHWLARRLREVEPNLQAYGVVIGTRKSGPRREVTLRKVCRNVVPPVPDDQACPGSEASATAAQLMLAGPGTSNCDAPLVRDARDNISAGLHAGLENGERKGGEPQKWTGS